MPASQRRPFGVSGPAATQDGRSWRLAARQRTVEEGNGVGWQPGQNIEHSLLRFWRSKMQLIFVAKHPAERQQKACKLLPRSLLPSQVGDGRGVGQNLNGQRRHS